MYLKKILFSLLLTLVTLQAESSVGLNINSEDLELQASVQMFSSSESTTAYIIDGAYLHTDHHNILRMGFRGENSFQNMGNLSLGFGAKAVFTDDFMALPLFAQANLILPFNSNIPTTTLSTSIAYAPSILSFIDAKNYTEFKLEADMEVISNIHLFTGYRNIDTDYETHDKTFNNSFYGGMKLSF
ncbi:hypothetical protein MNB_SV-3-560 [hydrothermal vent metagenome]|uniref:Outer membrane protein beta-barrel domain-containing protein n=1 Tax=hydrothermal vent metagenome TaxID=652676 RepID=A0A1W1CUZ8_9ZZZZ